MLRILVYLFIYLLCSLFAKWVTMWLSHSDDVQIKGNTPLSIMERFVNTIKQTNKQFSFISVAFLPIFTSDRKSLAAKITSA